jgi:hypothetical protein
VLLLIVIQDRAFDEKMQIVKNLYLLGVSEEFIALQLDLEIPVVIKIQRELDVYRKI